MINKSLNDFIEFIKANDGIANKAALLYNSKLEFGLIKDRSVYYSPYYAVRFSYSSSNNFSNTVISLSTLQKYDNIPFLVCLVTPSKNILYLANSTFLTKVSHSSQELRIDNIKGSINGSDISKTFNGICNTPENFDRLFNIHKELGFNGNLTRLVEATNNISPSGIKVTIDDTKKEKILSAAKRAQDFIASNEYLQLKDDLDEKVRAYKDEILIASFIENVNIRGRIIEYLIAGEDEELRQSLLEALKSENKALPAFRTADNLGDYIKIFNNYRTATDIKTKVMVLHSNPKAYNIDKMLEFLAEDKSVFLFYFIGIEPKKILNQVLISMFQKDLIKSTIVLKHWAGRNSRGVTQFEGEILNKLILSPNNDIEITTANNFINTLIEL